MPQLLAVYSGRHLGVSPRSCWFQLDSCAMEPTESLRTLILTAAKQVSLELQGDRIRLQLPSNPPADRIHSGPFARALRRYIPEVKIEEWDGTDTLQQPLAYSIAKHLLSKYTHWARCLGVADETLALPPWLEPLTNSSDQPTAFSEPSYFSQAPQKLTEHQKQGILFGVQRAGRLLLADDMGLGKSVQALGVAWQYRDDFPMLILCPTALIDLWKEEILKWTPITEVVTGTAIEPTAQVVIISYSLLGKFEQSFDGIGFKLVIADECHSIKTLDAQRSMFFLRVASLAHRLILISSGEVVLKSLMELHPLLQILDPKLGSESFLQRYGSKDKDSFRPRFDRREQELHSYLFKLIGLRRRKEEVFNELPLRRQKIFLNVGGSLSGELKRLEAELFRRGRNCSDSKQARLSEMKRLSHLVMQSKRRSCVEYITEISNNGIGKVVFFAYHREMLDSLEAALKDALGASGYVRVDQTVTVTQRTHLLACFEEDPRCHAALLSFNALSEDTELSVVVETMIFTEMAWAPGIILQCEGRSQNGSVQIQYLLGDSQWDSHCYQRLEEKRQLNRQLTHTQAAGAPTLVAPSADHTVAKEEINLRPSDRQEPRIESSETSETSDAVYRVVEHLHLGLNLKLQECYTQEALEKKCKGSQYKLKRLHDFMREAKKLQRVEVQLARPPKRQRFESKMTHPMHRTFFRGGGSKWFRTKSFSNKHCWRVVQNQFLADFKAKHLNSWDPWSPVSPEEWIPISLRTTHVARVWQWHCFQVPQFLWRPIWWLFKQNSNNYYLFSMFCFTFCEIVYHRCIVICSIVM